MGNSKNYLFRIYYKKPSSVNGDKDLLLTRKSLSVSIYIYITIGETKISSRNIFRNDIQPLQIFRANNPIKIILFKKN